MPEKLSHKRCGKCKEIKEISNFALNRTTTDGYQCYCRPCEHTCNKKYRDTERAANFRRKRVEKWQANNKHKHTAHESLHRRIKRGEIIRPNSCQQCKVECKPEAHHHKGYERKFWYDVIWLCRSCHANQ